MLAFGFLVEFEESVSERTDLFTLLRLELVDHLDVVGWLLEELRLELSEHLGYAAVRRHCLDEAAGSAT